MRFKRPRAVQPLANPYRVFVGIPTYDDTVWSKTMTMVLSAYGRAFPHSIVTEAQVASSSVAVSLFNSIWTSFLKSYNAGNVDLLLLLHADLAAVNVGHDRKASGIDAEAVDTLVETMHRRDWDALCPLVAIKDRGATFSTATNKHRFLPKRASMEDVELARAKTGTGTYEFSNQDWQEVFGQSLLINSGMLLLRPDGGRERAADPGSLWPKWAGDFKFDFQYALMETDQGPSPVQASEDWEASRYFHQMCVPYGVTGEVLTVHRGAMEYPSWDDGSGLYRPQ